MAGTARAKAVLEDAQRAMRARERAGGKVWESVFFRRREEEVEESESESVTMTTTVAIGKEEEVEVGEKEEKEKKKEKHRQHTFESVAGVRGEVLDEHATAGVWVWDEGKARRARRPFHGGMVPGG